MNNFNTNTSQFGQPQSQPQQDLTSQAQTFEVQNIMQEEIARVNSILRQKSLGKLGDFFNPTVPNIKATLQL
jgi:hypothetical protein